MQLFRALLVVDENEYWRYLLKAIRAAPLPIATDFLFYMLPLMAPEIGPNQRAKFYCLKIVDHLSENWRGFKRPSFKYEKIKNNLPSHPEVEQFLRSKSRVFSYSELPSLEKRPVSFVKSCVKWVWKKIWQLMLNVTGEKIRLEFILKNSGSCTGCN